MNTTDQAFIAAFQKSMATHVAPASVVAAGTPTQRIDLPHSGPRGDAPQPAPGVSAARSAKAPLSEHLARRKAEAADDRPLRPGVEVDALPWPSTAEELATKERQPLLDLLAGITKLLESNETPAVSLVGTRPGVGTTTTLLAMAKLVASVGGRVALVDASGPGGAASCLGVRRFAHLDARIDAAAIDDLLVSSRACGTSVLAIAAGDSDRFASTALVRLASSHDLVLIDAGDTTAWLTAAGPDRSAVLVVDEANAAGPDARHATAARLGSLGIATAGFVETYTPAS